MQPSKAKLRAVRSFQIASLALEEAVEAMGKAFRRDPDMARISEDAKRVGDGFRQFASDLAGGR